MRNGKILLASLFLLLWLIAGCDNAKNKEKPVDGTVAELTYDTVDFKPLFADVTASWIDNIKDVEEKYPGFIFIKGYGISANLSIAKNKSMLDAREKLMAKLSEDGDENTVMRELSNSRVLRYNVAKKNGKYEVGCLLAYKKN